MSTPENSRQHHSASPPQDQSAFHHLRSMTHSTFHAAGAIQVTHVHPDLYLLMDMSLHSLRCATHGRAGPTLNPQLPQCSTQRGGL